MHLNKVSLWCACVDIATVIAPYQATGPEQLSLQPGQLIDVRKKNPSGWWEGELQASSLLTVIITHAPSPTIDNI